VYLRITHEILLLQIHIKFYFGATRSH